MRSSEGDYRYFVWIDMEQVVRRTVAILPGGRRTKDWVAPPPPSKESRDAGYTQKM